MMLAFLTIGLCFCNKVLGQTSRGIRTKVNSVEVIDEDDPISDDEPYLILVRVRARLLNLTTTPRLDPTSIAVALSMNGQNDLGRSADNWADEPDTYVIPSATPSTATVLVPFNQANWVSCAIMVYMEEDAFSKSNATLLGNNLKTAIENELVRVAVVRPPLSINSLFRQTLGQTALQAVKNMMLGLDPTSTVDPDDFGGVQIVCGVTLANGNVWTYAGHPAPNFQFFNGANPLVVPGVVILGPSALSRTFSLSFPGGLQGGFLPLAKFEGEHKVVGKLDIFQQ